jgi:hypothetical protein
MQTYKIAVSFYVEEIAGSTEEATRNAVNKLRYRGAIYDVDAHLLKQRSE